MKTAKTTKKVTKKIAKKSPKIDERFQVKRGRPGTGLGLFARVPIKKGDFLLEYTGKRVPTKTAEESGSRYLFEIDDKWTIDGRVPANTAGYINHGCKPNVEAEIEEGDDGKDHVNYYALKNVPAGNELLIDYGEEYYDEFIKPKGCKCAAPKHN